MRYEVFRNRNSGDEDFNIIDAMYKRIMSEDKVLCLEAQKNLNAGIFVNGEMHPEMEQGPLFFQKLVREQVTGHHAKEQVAGTEYWPAQQRVPTGAKASQTDSNFCSAVECCMKKNAGVRDQTLSDVLAF